MPTPADPLIERAPAKINLTLHIVERRTDGWHGLESLVVFTRGGDTLSLTPGAALGLTVSGPTARAAGDLDENLVLRVARALARRVDGLKLGAFRLDKHLPVAAGVGGGSSDAAAALRLLARVNDLALDDPRVVAAAAETGADISVCLMAKARTMSGLGETLGPLLTLPPLPALIVNPGVPLETKTVFTRMALSPGWRTKANEHPAIAGVRTPETLFAALRRGRNDMEDAACLLAPVIVDVLAILGAARGCRLARMSGSGATCFGLFADCRTTTRAALAIRRVHPDWWIKPAMLG